MTAGKFTFSRDGAEISGEIYLPDDRDCRCLPIAVISHEFKTNMSFSRPYAGVLAEAGFAVFIYNFYGNFNDEMTISSGLKDLAAVIEYAKKQDYTDASDILLMGNCQGGLITSLYAAEHPQEEIKALILQYPGYSIPEFLSMGKLPGATFDSSDIPETVSCPLFTMSRKYILDAVKYHPYEELSGYSGKILIIHGNRDDVVDISYSEKAAETYRKGGSDVTFMTVNGAGHIFRDAGHIEEASGYIRDFLQKV